MSHASDEKRTRIWADFNGLFGDMLCLSHKDTSTDENGNEVSLFDGMQVTAFMEDLGDSGNRDDLIASGTVRHSPAALRCRGSRWVLCIDENGVRRQSDLK